MSQPFRYSGFAAPYNPVPRRRPAAPPFLAAFLFTALLVILLGIGALPLGAAADDGEQVAGQVVIFALMMGITFGIPAFVFFCIGVGRVRRNRRMR